MHEDRAVRDDWTGLAIVPRGVHSEDMELFPWSGRHARLEVRIDNEAGTTSRLTHADVAQAGGEHGNYGHVRSGFAHEHLGSASFLHSAASLEPWLGRMSADVAQ